MQFDMVAALLYLFSVFLGIHSVKCDEVEIELTNWNENKKKNWNELWKMFI